MGFYEETVIAERPEVLAQAIAETVANKVPGKPVAEPVASVIVRDRQLPAVLQPWVATILIMRFAGKSVRLWQRDMSITGIEGDVAAIAADITAKDANVPKYRPADE